MRRYFIVAIAILIIVWLARFAEAFPPVYVINLDRSYDRRALVGLQLGIHGVNYTRYPAIDGKSYIFSKEENDFYFSDPHWQKINKVNSVKGCALSHINVWRLAATNGAPYTIVMEDDIFPVLKFKELTKESITKLTDFDPEWEVLWLSGKDPEDRERVFSVQSHEIYRMNPPKYIGQGAVAYIISQKGLELFIHKLRKNGCFEALDWFMFKTIYPQHAYGIHRPIVTYTDMVPSTIVPTNEFRGIVRN
jgi:GR25 family glycosyltransferase involved in LPS biosynthesis